MEVLITALIINLGLLAILLLMFLNGFISTPPSELTLAIAGVFAYTTNLSLGWVFVVAIIGNLIGMYIPYEIGRSIGYVWLTNIKKDFSKKGKIKRKISQYIPQEKSLNFIANKFKEKPIWVGVFRCLPLVRSTITSLPAGVVKMPRLKFIFYSFLGVLVWTGFWILIGYFVGEAWHEVKVFGTIILIFVLLAIIYYMKVRVQRYFKKKLKF